MRNRAAGMCVDQVTGNGKELLGFVVTFTDMKLFLGFKNNGTWDIQDILQTWI
jgi:hypothetical protein